MTLPPAHPARAALHNEIHARPPEAMTPPRVLTHIVMLADAAQREASRTHLGTLLREHGLPPPAADANHLRLDAGGFRLRWELHTEFVTWTFSRPADASALHERNPPTATDAVPRAWLEALPGQNLAGLHLWVLTTSPRERDPAALGAVLREESLVGSSILDGHAAVYTDFALQADGCLRMVMLLDDPAGVSARRLGRAVQRLIEIDTYRMAAMLGLPAARKASEVLGNAERELAALAEAIRAAGRDQEPQLLDRLTRLAGQVESQYASTHSRFSASAAYFELVDRRLHDIGEARLAGLQTLGEFIERRLSPARATCAWSVRRQDALSQRVSRISNLLRTRVEIEQQQSSQALLATMNRRQGLQLKLQATVEGLSVAAITYYVVGLINYLAKGLQAIGWPWSAEVTAACAIPAVALAVWLSLRRLHAALLHH
jgi:uncharacterized membrane-anchored protein